MRERDTLNLDYYYGAESEQYSFFRIPRLLIKDSRYRRLSNEAKLLYGLMLDRMSLSRRNGWLDEQNRAYIRYSISDVCEDLGCSKNTATKLLMELDTQHGIGLIERIRVGLGASSIIYVKNFASAGDDPKEDVDRMMKASPGENRRPDPQPDHDKASGGSAENDAREAANQPFITDSQNLGIRNPNNWESAFPENGNQKSQNLGISIPKNCESGIPEIRTLNSQDLGPNYNYMNKTDRSKTDSIQTDQSYTNRSDTDPIHQSGSSHDVSAPDAGLTGEGMDRMDEKTRRIENGQNSAAESVAGNTLTGISSTYRSLQECKNAVAEQIGLDDLRLVYPDRYHHGDLVEEIFKLLVELYYNPRESIRIGSQEYRWDFVIDRLQELREDHIRYVIDCFIRTSTKIHDIRSYLLRSLINAPATIDHYYQADANYDGGEAV